MDGEPKFISMEAWHEARCKKPVVRDICGAPMTFNCLRMRGHEGKCAEAIVKFKDGND